MWINVYIFLFAVRSYRNRIGTVSFLVYGSVCSDNGNAFSICTLNCALAGQRGQGGVGSYGPCGGCINRQVCLARAI